MSPLGWTPLETTTAQLDGHAVVVPAAHRRWAAAGCESRVSESVEYEPVAVTVTAPVRLSLEDVAVVLFELGIADGEDFTDECYVRVLVAEVVVNAGSLRIEELRCQLAEPVLNAEHAAYLAYCRQRAAAVFGTAEAPRHPALVSRSRTPLLGVC